MSDALDRKNVAIVTAGLVVAFVASLAAASYANEQDRLKERAEMSVCVEHGGSFTTAQCVMGPMP